MTPKYELVIEVPRQHSEDLRRLFKKEGLYQSDILLEAVDVPSFLIVLGAIIEIIGIIRRWRQKKKTKTVKIRMFKYDEVRCATGKEITRFEKKGLKEIEIELKEE